MMAEEEILSLIDGKIPIPSVPAVANRVLEIANDPDSTAGQLEEALRDDSNLVARTLRMANSSLYARVERVKSVRDAITLLGYKKIVCLVLAASTRSLYAPFGLHENMLWEHSVGTAITSGLLASEFDLLKPDVLAILRDSLEALIASAFNSKEAAARLGVHRNTLTTRIQRIGELFGVDLRWNAEARDFLSMLTRYLRLPGANPERK